MLLKYYLHDSMIERFYYSKQDQKVSILMTLCNWMQDDYKPTDPEMLSVSMTLDGVTEYISNIQDGYEFNGNSILNMDDCDVKEMKIVFMHDAHDKGVGIIAFRYEMISWVINGPVDFEND